MFWLLSLCFNELVSLDLKKIIIIVTTAKWVCSNIYPSHLFQRYHSLEKCPFLLLANCYLFLIFDIFTD